MTLHYTETKLFQTNIKVTIDNLLSVKFITTIKTLPSKHQNIRGTLKCFNKTAIFLIKNT